MRAQDRLAALKALQHGLGEAITRAEREVANVREQTGAKSFDTELGTVSVAVRKSRVVLPDADLVRWCEENGFDHEVVKSVRPSFRRAIGERFVIERGAEGDPDCVVDAKSGQVIDWALIQAGTEYVRTMLTPEAKQNAAEAALDRLPVLWLAEVQEVEQ